MFWFNVPILAEAIVPEEILEPFKLVRPEPLPVTVVVFTLEKVWIPVWTAPDACACILTLPAESFRAVASIPVKDAPLPWNAVAVTTPAFPSLILLPTVASPDVTFNPALAVTIPIESTF